MTLVSLRVGLALALVVVIGGACSSPEQRADDHMARAERLTEGDFDVESLREASIELRNAVQLTPKNPIINARLGTVLLSLGVVEDATFYLEEAHRLAPDDPEITTDLARVLLFGDPLRSLTLAQSILASEVSPTQRILALLVHAEADAALGRHRSALRSLDEAGELDPTLAGTEWTRARVYESKIRALLIQPGATVFDPRDFEHGVAACDAYVEKGGEEVVAVLVSKAKLQSVWPGHRDEAIATLREAIDHAEGQQQTQIDALETLYGIASATGERDAQAFALEKLAELEPTRVDRWGRAIKHAQNTGRDPQALIERMMEVAGEDPRAHVVYARSLGEREGLSAAVEYLRGQIDQSDGSPILLASLVAMQTRGGRPLDGNATLVELQTRFPDDVNTSIVVARRALHAGDARGAIEQIETVALDTSNPEALRLLARSRERIGEYEQALAVVDKIIASEPNVDASIRTLRAQLLRKKGDPTAALAALRRLSWRTVLTPSQELLWVQCDYDLGHRMLARRRLLSLLEAKEPRIDAVLEFYEREGHRAEFRKQARQILGEAHERAPQNMEVLSAVLELDFISGQPEIALIRLSNALIERPYDPELFALRARTRLRAGRIRGARLDADRALLLRPGQGDEALAVLITLAEQTPNREGVLAGLRTSYEGGEMPLHRRVIYGRMLALSGHPEQGLAILEDALADGAQYTSAKADVAYLLVATGGDLDRAQALAREAVETPGKQIVAADVLGLVYMAQGMSDAALWQFRFAVDNSAPTDPNFLLHLGMALEELGRPSEARDAYARALEIDPEHANSRAALTALGLPQAVPQTDPS